MRITRLYLKNFIGIKNGMDRDEIEIRFPDNGNHIVMFNGKNGSGKSTIMSQLTPFKDSFDDRKGVIVPGAEGIKEIDIEHDGHEYKIQHRYSTPPASFIQKDGVELNTNGGVRTFEDIVKTEFGLDKEYFKVGKIGSNTTNFIQFTPTQRKTYIANFVEAVQKFLDAFAIVNKKAKANDDRIERLGSELQKIDDATTLAEKIKANSDAYAEYDKAVSAANTLIGQYDASIAASKEIVDSIDFISDKAKLAEINGKLAKNAEVSAKFKTQYSGIAKENLKPALEKARADLSAMKSDQAKNDSAKLAAATAEVDAENALAKANAHLTGKTVIDLESLSATIADLKKKKADGEALFSNDQLTKVIKGKYAVAQSHLDMFSSFMKTILNDYAGLNSSEAFGARNAEMFFGSDFSPLYNSRTAAIRERAQRIRESIDSKTNERASMSSNIGKLDILSKRPAECHIDSCPFIADALRYSDLPDRLKSIDDELERLKAESKSDEEEAEKLIEVQRLYSEVAQAFNSMKHKENIAYAYFRSKHGGIAEFTKLPKTRLEAEYRTAKSEIEQAISAVVDYNDATTKLSVAEAQYERAMSSEQSRVYFEQEAANAKVALANAKTLVASTQLTESDLAAKISAKEAEIKDYADFSASLEDGGRLESEKAEVESEIALYEKNSKIISSLGIQREAQSKAAANAAKARADVMDAITKLKADEITLNKLQSDLAALKATFADTSLVKKSLDPKSGIPLVFVQSYLEGTESVANELLKIAYGGKFEIKFVADAGNFFIQVRCGGNVIEDIKYASQGEIAMTTISISLALIERSMGKFDIMYLDEIDGPLDRANRESFINIINKQIEKLGLQQIFVISHNNAFDSCDMNMVLLPGNAVDKDDSDFMKNKTVIFDAGD